MNDRSMILIKQFLERQEEIEAMPDGPEKEEEIRSKRRRLCSTVIHGTARNMGGLPKHDGLKGQTRKRIGIDAEDSPKLEFMDESGQVTNSFEAPS